MNFVKLGLFVGGALFGSAGIAVLSSDDAKKAYTHCTAAALRGRDKVMETAATVRENCEDIYAEAEDMNEERYEAKAKARLEEAKAIVAEYEQAAEEE